MKHVRRAWITPTMIAAACTLAACSSPPPVPPPPATRVYRISVPLPGASVEQVDATVAGPVFAAVRGLSGVKNVRAISREGLATLYVKTDAPETDLRAALAGVKKQLPAASKTETFETLPATEEIPTVTPHRKKTMTLSADPAKLAAFGITVTELTDAIRAANSVLPTTPAGNNSIGETVVRTVNGSPIRVQDVATLKWEEGADVIVRDAP